MHFIQIYNELALGLHFREWIGIRVSTATKRSVTMWRPRTVVVVGRGAVQFAGQQGVAAERGVEEGFLLRGHGGAAGVHGPGAVDRVEQQLALRRAEPGRQAHVRTRAVRRRAGPALRQQGAQHRQVRPHRGRICTSGRRNQS